MMKPKTLKYTLLCLSLLAAVSAAAQTDSTAAPSAGRIRGVQYASASASDTLRNAETPLFAGFSVSGNLAGVFLAVFTSYGELEGAVRVNLREKYFPVAEVGIGVCNNHDEATDLHYKTRAPFFRLGCDYNFLSNNPNGNRVFAGARVGFSAFKYDISGPAFTDPVWGGTVPNSFTGVSGNQSWLELVFGIEAKIWSIFHLGWSLRYKNRITHSSGKPGEPWYVPGYGKGGNSVIGATFNLVFDI